MKGEALSALVGVSAPEVPKYLLLNNFLADFFETGSIEENQYTYKALIDKGILVCEESDAETKEDLERSFNEFFLYFLGREQLSGIRTRKDKIYMPLSLGMLRSVNVNLRHLLYNLAFCDEQHSNVDEIRDELYHYLYHDSTGIYNIVSQFCGPEKERHDKVKGSDGFEKMREDGFFRKLGQRFNNDLHCLLTHPYFLEQDFYKRINDLSVLLTMYVVLFFVYRVTKEVPVLLCQGSDDSRLNDSGLHRVCISNYQSFRDSFSNLLSEFYSGRIQAKKTGTDKNKEGKAAVGGAEEGGEETFVRVQNWNGVIHVEGKPLIEYANEVFDGNYKDDTKLNQKAKTVFQLEEEQQIRLSSAELAEYYLQLTGKISGTNQKRIFSVLQSSGKEIGLVHPASRSRFKYFAMSGEITAFLVRLYLASSSNKLGYAFTDDFMQYLEKNYGFYIRNSNKKVENLVKKSRIRVSQQEFSRNEQAFLETLDNVNCLIRLSDSGYVITLPEKKGEFKLL